MTRSTLTVVNEAKDKIRSYIANEGREPGKILVNISDYRLLQLNRSNEDLWHVYATKANKDKLLGLDLLVCYDLDSIEVVR